MEEFRKTVLDQIQRKTRILDIGCGDGSIAEEFSNKGAYVLAIDKKLGIIKESTKVDYRNISLEEFIELETNDKYDLIFMRNVAQFIDKSLFLEVLLPKLMSKLTRQGVIAIESFYAEPEPPFEKPLVSLYKISDFGLAFKNFDTIIAKQRKKFGNSLDGKQRNFYLTNIIVRKRG